MLQNYKDILLTYFEMIRADKARLDLALKRGMDRGHRADDLMKLSLKINDQLRGFKMQSRIAIPG